MLNSRIASMFILMFVANISAVFSQQQSGLVDQVAEFDEVGRYLHVINDPEFIRSLELAPAQLLQLNRLRHELVMAIHKCQVERVIGGSSDSIDNLQQKFFSIRDEVSKEVLLPHQKQHLLRYFLAKEFDHFVKHGALYKGSFLESLELTKEQRSKVKLVQNDSEKKILEARRAFERKKDEIEEEHWKNLKSLMTESQTRKLELILTSSDGGLSVRGK